MGDLNELAARVEAREQAAKMFRPHDWRGRELLEGRWDHHPTVVEHLRAHASLKDTGK